VRAQRDRTGGQRRPDHRGPGRMARGQELTVHGWAYDLSDGVIRDLKMSMDGPENWKTATPQRWLLPMPYRRRSVRAVSSFRDYT